MSDTPIILSLISLGLLGGFSHCVGMCSPFVITQVSNRLEKIPLQKFSNFEKLKNLALLPYHLGRITTYSIIGIGCSYFAKNIREFSGFKIISAVFLLIAASIFLGLFWEKNFFQIIKNTIKNKLPFKSKTLKIRPSFLRIFSAQKLIPELFPRVLSTLFKNPQGFNGFYLGIILGFIPCGLLYSAFLLAATISSPFMAGIGMFLFGIATFPALFFTASGGYFFLKNFKKELRIISKTVLMINFITLFIMAISLIT